MQKENPLREIGLLVTGLVIVGLVTAVIITTSRGSLSNKPSSTTTPFPTPSTGVPTIQVLSPYPEPLDFRTPTEAAKQTEAVPRMTQKAIMLATHMAITPSPSPQITYPPTRTVENMYIKPSGEKLGLDAQNGWFGLVDGIKVDLFAGALLGNPTQGALYLFMAFPRSGVSELILTPTKHGGVRVVSENNNRLTMISTDGTTYFFDVPARQFVNSLTEVVATATMLPTITPIPPPSTPIAPLSTLNPYPAPTSPGTAVP